LKTFDLRARERPLAVYGPSGLRELMTLALRTAGRVRFPLELVELVAGDMLERDGYRIAPVPITHRSPAFAYVLFEDERPGVFDPDAAVRLGLEPGPEFGRVQRGETIPVGVLRDEARAIFPRTVLPRDFDTIEIPLAERGEPELVRWEDRAHPTAGALADSSI
jgi:ribonuclease BN (tRNA processing enzyme)